jgi:hypothetical protein
MVGGVSEWTLYVADRTGVRVAQIDLYTRLELIARYNAVSTWTLELPATGNPAVDALTALDHPRIVVRVDNTTFRSGPVTRIERNATADRDELVVTGVDDLVWLTRRLAHPQPGAAAPPYNTTAYDVRTGAASTVLAQYVDVNAGPGATPARRVEGLTVPPPAPAGPVVTLSARYDNLGDFVIAAAEAAGLGVRIVDLALDVYVPAVRDALFAVEVGTLEGSTSVFDAPTANYVYVAGQGEGTARTIVETADATSVADWGRVEAFGDRRDTNDAGELARAGREVLARGVTPATITFVPVDTAAQSFPAGWTVGDIVTVRVGDLITTDIVREVAVNLEGDKPVDVVPRMGAAGGLALFRAAAQVDRRVRQLERV